MDEEDASLEEIMKTVRRILIVLTITALVLVGMGLLFRNVQAMPTTKLFSYTSYPSFTIVGVVEDDNVTIQAYNLPPNDNFVVTMGPMGTQGIGGIVVDTVASGSGGSKQYTFDIPSSLYGSYKISIRMQSPTSGYYAYNWFYNNTTGVVQPTPTPGPSPTPGPTQPPGYTGFPVFKILSVVADSSVTIETNNLPPNDSFVVTMGPMGTKGIGGIVVDTVDSGTGGTKQYTFSIPSSLYGSYKISIRMQSPTSAYYAYNWFYNNTTGAVQPTATPGPSPTQPPGYTGYPAFNILSVVRDSSVTIKTINLPPSDSFVVTMGPMGTQGIGGIVVDTVDSGTGGTKQYTFSIPSALYGSYKISIRMQSPTSGYYAYNWFYNNTAAAP